MSKFMGIFQQRGVYIIKPSESDSEPSIVSIIFGSSDCPNNLLKCLLTLKDGLKIASSIIGYLYRVPLPDSIT